MKPRFAWLWIILFFIERAIPAKISQFYQKNLEKPGIRGEIWDFLSENVLLHNALIAWVLFVTFRVGTFIDYK